MKASELVRYAAGALRGHRLRTWLSVLGVAIGVASVILLTSLGEGARQFVTGEFASLGSNLVIVIPGKTETHGAAPFVSVAPHDLTVEDTEAIEREIPEVDLVAPLAIGVAPASFGERSRNVTIAGTTHAFREIRKLEMHTGRFLPPGVTDEPVCTIGAKVRRELFGERSPLGETIHIGEARFRVIGVVAPRGMSIGTDLDEVVHIPVRSALELFNRTGLFRILVDARSHRDIDLVGEKVKRLLIERHDDEEDMTILTQDAVLSTFDKILRALTAALGGIAAISLTVAGIGIMNVMLVSVSERTREIGLLKALGVTRRQVVAVFLVEATVISVLGGLAGLAVGLLGGEVMRRMWPEFPVQAPLWAIIASLAVSIAVGLGFGAMPARQAARLDPVEALMRRRA